VKRGELYLHSSAVATVIVSYLASEEIRLRESAHPEQSSHDIANGVRARVLMMPDFPKEGIIKIEREWKIPQFENEECVATLRYCLELLQLVLLDCQARLLDTPVEGDIPTIAQVHEYASALPLARFAVPAQCRSVSIELRTGVPFEVRLQEQELNLDESIDEVRLHYGGLTEPLTPGILESPRAIAHYYMRLASRIMRTDGFHDPLAILFRDKVPSGVIALRFENNSQKFAIWEKVAREVAERGSDTIVVVGEAWTAPIDSLPRYGRAEESLERREVLNIDVLTSTGEYIQLVSRIGRVAGSAIVTPPRETESGVPYYLNPIMEHWKNERRQR